MDEVNPVIEAAFASVVSAWLSMMTNHAEVMGMTVPAYFDARQALTGRPLGN